MRALSLFVTAIFGISCSVTFLSSDRDKPIAGKSYTLLYDALDVGILSEADQVWVVYAIDYWGTRAVQKLRGEGESDLFQNVLEPDSGRASRILMVRSGRYWKAEIPIPANASLLSYYFTDGTRYDYNNRKTYISNIFDDNGKPVRGSRFRNVDFLLMSGAGAASILEELRKETNEYPDHLLAHLVYWRFRLFDTVSPDTLRMLMSELEQYYTKLQGQYGDTVLNYKALSLDEINRIIRLSLQNRSKESVVADLTKSVNTKILETIEKIPTEKRLRRVTQLASFANYMLLSPEERERLEEESRRRFEEMISEFVGQPAPDFSFETTSGEKHRLSDFRGTFVLLDFWGSWCGPCVQEIPNLVQIHEKFEGRGLVIISVSNDASASKWDRANLVDYTEKKGMKWMQVLDDPTNIIHNLYKIQFWPNVFLIDREGKVMQRQGLRGDELAKILSSLLDK
ncbi:MAG: redoxin domain-containing protein [Ignavibacteriales bacterium]|nr:redoxin domain-containing protein [Ignavibacteriales bacterium]